MSRPYIGDADDNYVRMSLADFGRVAAILKAAGYEMEPGRRNGRGATKLHRLTKAAAPSVQAETPTDPKLYRKFVEDVKRPSQPASPDARELARRLLHSDKWKTAKGESGWIDIVAEALQAQRQAGEQAGLERAAQAMCEHCAAGREIVHEETQPIKWGHYWPNPDKSARNETCSAPCKAAAIRALLPDPKVKPMSKRGRVLSESEILALKSHPAVDATDVWNLLATIEHLERERALARLEGHDSACVECGRADGKKYLRCEYGEKLERAAKQGEGGEK